MNLSAVHARYAFGWRAVPGDERDVDAKRDRDTRVGRHTVRRSANQRGFSSRHPPPVPMVWNRGVRPFAAAVGPEVAQPGRYGLARGHAFENCTVLPLAAVQFELDLAGGRVDAFRRGRRRRGLPRSTTIRFPNEYAAVR